MSEIWPRGGIWGGRPSGPALRAPRLPGPGSVLASQVRYQLTLLARNPRVLVAGLVLPGALLALERGHAQHITMAQAAPRIAGLVALSAIAIAFFTHANGLVVAREDGVLRRWHASPLPAWAYFAGRIMATMLVTAVAGLILVLVAIATTGVHLTAHAVVGLLVVDLLGALVLAAAGTAITAIIPSAQSAQPVLMLVYIPADRAVRCVWCDLEPAALGEHRDDVHAGPAGDRRRVARASARRGHHVRSRPGSAGRMGGGRPAALVLVLPLGPAPPGARTACRGPHHGSFGTIRKR